ncbi:6-bladed beta-propeller [Gemmatimonadota bacterium]
MRFTKLITYMVVIVIAGCSTEKQSVPGTEAPQSEFETSSHAHEYQLISNDPYPVVMNLGGPGHPGRLQLELDLSIGRDTGPDEYILYSPVQIEVDPQGRIYVVDGRRRATLVYDSQGKFLAQLGREGNGPGEFNRGRMNIQVYSNGVVDANDARKHYARWNPDLTLADDYRIHEFDSPSTNALLTTLDEQYAYFVKSPWYQPDPDTTTAWWIVQFDLVSQGTSGAIPFNRGRETHHRGIHEGDNVSTIMPFSTELMIGQHPDGRYVVAECDSSCYQVFDTVFKPIREVRWIVERQALDHDTFLSAYDILYPKSRDNWSEMDKQFERWRKTIPWPELKPVLATIVAAADGRVWVESWGDQEWTSLIPYPDPDGVHEYWVFSREGELEFQTTLPFRVHAADDQHLYELVNDRESTPQVRRYQWSPPLGD